MPSFDIDPDFIERLAELLQRTGLNEIEICQGDARVRVAKQATVAVEHVVPPPVPVTAVGTSVATPAALAAASPAAETLHPGTITSPMVGTAYLASEPGAPPFAPVGEMVKEGQTLLIIEAMKVMNAIRAPRVGRVLRVFVENAAPVEFGEPLLILE
jgi:acetyl-CoA carboxylase biotin carboxyl carrier protein